MALPLAYGDGAATLVLSPMWRVNTGPRDDPRLDQMRRLLADCKPEAAGATASDPLTLIENVPYLCAVDEALNAMGFAEVRPRRCSVRNPAFPKSSFYYHRFECDPQTGAPQNRAWDIVMLITDRADQVVGIQFCDLRPEAVQLTDHATSNALCDLVGSSAAPPGARFAHRVTPTHYGARIECETVDAHGTPIEFTECRLARPVINLMLEQLAQSAP